MKHCKSCQKEIENTAIKCPYCQSFQSKWRNPQLYPLFFVLPFLLFSFWNLKKLNRESFVDHKSEITLSLVNQTKERLILEINNTSNLVWDSPQVRVTFFDAKDQIIGVKNDSQYSVTVLPKSKAIIEVDAKPPAETHKSTWEITSMSNRNY